MTFRLLFEILCIKDLRVYVDFLGGDVLHYRDKSSLECGAGGMLKELRYKQTAAVAKRTAAKVESCSDILCEGFFVGLVGAIRS